jgi:hypothetical protein
MSEDSVCTNAQKIATGIRGCPVNLYVLMTRHVAAAGEKSMSGESVVGASEGAAGASMSGQS